LDGVTYSFKPQRLSNQSLVQQLEDKVKQQPTTRDGVLARPAASRGSTSIDSLAAQLVEVGETLQVSRRVETERENQSLRYAAAQLSSSASSAIIARQEDAEEIVLPKLSEVALRTVRIPDEVPAYRWSPATLAMTESVYAAIMEDNHAVTKAVGSKKGVIDRAAHKSHRVYMQHSLTPIDAKVLARGRKLRRCFDAGRHVCKEPGATLKVFRERFLAALKDLFKRGSSNERQLTNGFVVLHLTSSVCDGHSDAEVQTDDAEAELCYCRGFNCANVAL
jgi:hypothetical protein